ncbi:MAG: hypothetical protein A3B38_01155 [Candidatus Levybacteria bacterium RIFCSPLOWO2_01_FULL_36_13]|nr:MAG: hypothetical protein A2684_02395 [Candidatus Levybacteria bacterium RIFCSPHIGHO2_01_FULL_36_15b]OGH35494.1 MAG: hypothetical protein A3B38_01155 [Candidatus Levybacteria bacterium RIFCSPLOWO2_01_FULL_36_13]
MDFNKDIKDVRFNVNLSTVLIIYRQYKNYFLPFAIIVASLVVLFIILIPQVQGVLTAKEEEKRETQKLTELKNSYNNLSAMNEATLGQNVDSLERALPSTKDFAGIINSISSNAVKAGVSVGNFEFSVGDLSKSQEGVAFPTIAISLNVSGSPKSTLEFIKNLYESVPIAEITSMKLSGESTSLKVQFYYKANSQISLKNNTAITQFNKNETALIAKINKWAESVIAGSLPIAIGSEGEVATESSRANPFQ